MNYPSYVPMLVYMQSPRSLRKMWFFLLLQLLTLFCCGYGLASNQGPTANTENGPVRGIYDFSQSGSKFLSFRGIPYAKPPVGSYRFKEPQSLKEKWIGEWDARKYGSACLQLNQVGMNNPEEGSLEYPVEGSEDCLFVNVFTREDGPAKKNVVFMVHGGAFMFGSSNWCGPAYIMDRDDIVLVTINYRVGPLGFITTGDGIIPGNNGLKDQVAALQWVHRNIENFGGDPSKISIAGLSAGGASVDYLFLTPLTKGLFQRGISFSGTALCPWALVTNGPERTKKLAEELGCPTKDSKTILKCLRRRPAEKIVEAVKNFLVFHYNPFTVFGPVIENNSTNYIINQHPREILKQGLAHDLPWIAGVTSEDGLYPAAFFATKPHLLKTINDEWHRIGSSLLFLDPKHSQPKTENILTAVKKQYFGDEEIGTSTKSNFIKLLTDRVFLAGVVETAQLRKSSYLYYYKYRSATSFADVMTGKHEDLGACHVDDFMHIADIRPFVDSQTTEDDRAMGSVLKNLFFEFVSNGVVPKEYDWKPLSSSNKYLILNSPTGHSVSDQPLINVEEHLRLFETSSENKDEL